MLIHWPKNYLRYERVYCRKEEQDLRQSSSTGCTWLKIEQLRLKVLIRRIRFNKLWNKCFDVCFEANPHLQHLQHLSQ